MTGNLRGPDLDMTVYLFVEVIVKIGASLSLGYFGVLCLGHWGIRVGDCESDLFSKDGNNVISYLSTKNNTRPFSGIPGLRYYFHGRCVYRQAIVSANSRHTCDRLVHRGHRDLRKTGLEDR